MHNRRYLPWSSVVVLAIVCALGIGGCSGKQMWYQPGKRQVDYDRDAQECTLIAKEFARQATMTGTSEDPAAFQKTMRSCLMAKGWSMTTPALLGEKADAPAGAEQLAAADGGGVQAFGGQVTIPERFSLATTTKSGTGPTVLQNFLYRGPQDTYINIMAQKTVAKADRFEPAPYPVQPPFFLYEQGGATEGLDEPQWAIFCGKINDDWVMGLGSYFLINNKERITVIVTRPLIAPVTKPEAGFQLSREQFAMVDAFKAEWVAWLAANVTVPPKSLWSRIPFPRGFMAGSGR